jgi:anti-anti-sigma factor
MIDIKTRPDTTLECKPLGAIDWRSSTTLRHAVHEAMCPGHKIIIDLGQVAYIDAVGLSAIIGIVRRAPAVGATVALSNARPPVRRRIDLVNGGDPNRITAGVPRMLPSAAVRYTGIGHRATSRWGDKHQGGPIARGGSSLRHKNCVRSRWVCARSVCP